MTDNTLKPGRLGLYALLLLVCLSGLLLSGRWFLAGLAQHRVQQDLLNNAWSAQNPPPAASWQTLHDDIQYSISLNPRIAESYRMLDQLFESGQPANPNADFSDSLSALRQAARQQPGWPDNWTQLAWVKANNGEIDAEFLQALQNGLFLGFFETRLQTQLMTMSPLAILALDDPNNELFTLADTYIMNGLYSGGDYARKLAILDNFGLVPAYCQKLNLSGTPAAVQNRCNSLSNDQ